MILLRIKTVRLLYGASDVLFKLGLAMHDRVKHDMAEAGVDGGTGQPGLRKIAHTPSPSSNDSESSIAGRVLLASLVGMSIALTWLWFVARAMG